MKQKLNIALFHPWIKSRGGAEKVVLELLKDSKHNIDVYTWTYDEASTFEEFKRYKKKIKVLTPLFGKMLSRLHLLRGLFFPLSLFKKIPLDRYDKLLISTSGVGEFITFRNCKKGHTHAYVHTPLREADQRIVEWNLNNRYRNKRLKKYWYLFAVKVYRLLERRAWKRLDRVMFNSELSKSRAQQRNILKDKPHHVILPPIEINRLKTKQMRKKKNFVYFSRLNPPKRQDLLIEAWKRFVKKHKKYTLTIVGNPDNKAYHQHLLDLTKNVPSVSIKTHVPDNELAKILSQSVAGIFLGYQEDLGITPLELVSLKKPLLAVDQGGYVDLIKDHELFLPIKEVHDHKKMVTQVARALHHFVEKYKHPKKIKPLRLKNFAKEVDKFLEKE